MRQAVLLLIGLAMAGPVHAQHVSGISGIHFDAGMSGRTPAMSYSNPGASDFSTPLWRESDIGKAQGLLAVGRYAEADMLLSNLIGRTSSKQVRFFKGAAKLGMGDAVAARRYFKKSVHQGRNGYPGALSGLAIAEIRLGNRDAAENILQKLRNQQAKCGLGCDRAKLLDQAVAVVEKALT